MVILLAIIIIVVLLLLDSKESSKLREEENKIVGYNTKNGLPILKKYVNITSYDIRTGQPNFEYKKPIIGYNPNTGYPVFEGEKIPKPKVERKPLTADDKAKISNTIFMVVGAILVVIASLIFLVTGWETMHGLLKTIILIAVQLSFYAFGYISNNKLNIPKIGKMFNYLTLAFVPVIIMSLSFFGLVGEFFSILGEGFHYYIGISLLISDVIYKIYGKLKQDLLSKRASLILEIFAILFLISKVDFYCIEAFALILHTIIMYLLLQGGYLDDEAYGNLNYIYSIILIAVAGLPALMEVCALSFTNLLLLAISFFLRCLDVKEDGEKKVLMIWFFISYLLAIKIIDEVAISPYFLYIIALIPILCLIKVVKTANMKKNIINVVGILTIAITLFSILDGERTIYYLLTYVLSFLVSIIVYLITKKSLYKLWSYMAFSSIFICMCYVFNINGIAEYVLLITGILVYALENVFEKLKDKTSDIFVMGCLCAETILLFETYYLFMPLVLMIVYLLLEKAKSDFIIPMVYALLIFSIEESPITITITTLLTITYTLLSLANKNFNKYSIFSLAYVYICCDYIGASEYVYAGTALIWSLAHHFVKRDNKFYPILAVLSIWAIYTQVLIDSSITLYTCYVIGVIIAMISISRGIFKNSNNELIEIIHCIVISFITLISTVIITEAMDGVFLLGVLLLLSLVSYLNKWKPTMICSIICMIFGVLVLTVEYWKEIPWYVYILIIGLALIIFAMNDEKRKQNARQQLQQMELQQPMQPVVMSPQVNVPNPVVEATPVVESQPVVQVTPVVVETQPIVEEKTAVEAPRIDEEIQIVEEQPVVDIIQEEQPVEYELEKPSNEIQHQELKQKLEIQIVDETSTEINLKGNLPKQKNLTQQRKHNNHNYKKTKTVNKK